MLQKYSCLKYSFKYEHPEGSLFFHKFLMISYKIILNMKNIPNNFFKYEFLHDFFSHAYKFSQTWYISLRASPLIYYPGFQPLLSYKSSSKEVVLPMR
jgi:hypothetical protein